MAESPVEEKAFSYSCTLNIFVAEVAIGDYFLKINTIQKLVVRDLKSSSVQAPDQRKVNTEIRPDCLVGV